MRAIIQRVAQASVKVEGTTISQIKQGLLVFLGIESADDENDLLWLVDKLGNLRIFSDADGKMNLSVKDVSGSVIVVSQFTLHAKTKKGTRPSFIHAAAPSHAEPLYQQFITEFSNRNEIQTFGGKFGANMQVELLNDGPVTIIIDTKNKE
ncbi:MAG: D-aminoacyl-tRNA deacylase [Flavobacteriales bacterium]